MATESYSTECMLFAKENQEGEYRGKFEKLIIYGFQLTTNFLEIEITNINK